MFLPLTKDEIKQIAVLMLRGVTGNLKERSIGIEFNDKAMNMLADLGYDPQFGARPLKRVIQKEVVNELSKYILSGKVSDGDLIEVSTDAKGFAFTIKEGVIEEEE